MDEPIATEVVLVQRSNAAPFKVTLLIGRPYQDPEHPDEWACPASHTPLYSKLRDARSNSAFHSLCLATSLVLDLLQAIVEQGGSVSLVTGEPFPFEAYAFGVAAGQRKTTRQ